jgi:hypothetical protein
VLGSGEGAENRAEKVDAVSNPETVRAMLEDYRAGLTVDAEMDRQDRKAGRRITCSATTFAGVGVCEGFTTDDLSAADPGPRAVHARGGHAQRKLLPRPSRWPGSRSELAGDRPCSLANQVADVLAVEVAAGRDYDADRAHGFAIGVEDRAGQ